MRTYNYAKASDEQLADARREANAIFKQTNIAVAWVDCALNESERQLRAICTDPLREGRDFVLRLMEGTRKPPSSTDRMMALGTSMLDREQRGGVLMTLDLFPIQAISEDAAIAWPVLLGRAIAHEMGHLLLGTSDHPKAGLMRARWSHDELRGLKPAQWGFSRREAAQMRQGLRSRAHLRG